MRVERLVIVRNELGLHARPAAMVVKVANAYEADIFFDDNGDRASCKSVLALLMLAAAKDRELLLVAEGADSEVAIEEVFQLFEDNFGEG